MIAPVFEEFVNGFRVVLFNQRLNKQEDVGVNVGINELMEIIRNSPGINAKKIRQYFDVADRTLERWLKHLRDEDKIIFKGAPKTGGYFIKKG
ncbi:hypothetical protein FAZ19_21060 [Sphingobacterium alkalisoli]|uniref:HTH domain-containing protein n=1 Tax=Sphingobacterium alkalisoli TaxID=1874115 RepID=A0A4U0GSF7_9SPHI|nr:hypothetical protein [Sphingobacterium alkalisoli]TJY61394.1 hypothetical protein FAZ19_21060 [Sphingobacterium alkalisoli]GGH30656.1 hypothetical protein GCM10011418_42870 [Sphingobacterium alkalisoli]